MGTERKGGQRIYNAGGGTRNALSLAQLNAWCDAKFAEHKPEADLRERPYDVPWVIMDSVLADRDFAWTPETSLEDVLEEIACHAEQHPEWLERCGV
jgi:CDP-paratose 2-epimerase